MNHFLSIFLTGLLPIFLFKESHALKLTIETQTMKDCVEWVMLSPQVKDRVQAIRLCQKSPSQDCLDEAYKSPSVTSRIEAVDLCSH